MYKKITTFGLSMLFLSSTLVVQAQTSNTVPAAPGISIYKAKILRQADRNFAISFDLYNKVGMQPNVKYGIQVTDAKGSLVDFKVFDEMLGLTENDLKHRDVVYQAPPGLSGSYKLWVWSENRDGLTLGLAYVDTVSVDNPTGLKIDQNSCFLKVKGDKTDKKYSLSQGVDILPTETLTLSCSVTNFGQAARVSESLETHQGSVFGKAVVTADLVNPALDIAAKASKVITLDIPKPSKPGLYEAAFGLANSENVLSNKLIVRYVISGQTANIQNAVLDSESYKAGDTAHISVTYSGYGPRFAGSRLNTVNPAENLDVQIALSGKDGYCSNAYTSTLPGNKTGTVSFDVGINKECRNPELTVVLASAGKILDSKTYSNNSFDEAVMPETSSNMDNLKVILPAVAVLAIIIILILYFLLHKKKMISPSSNSSPNNPGPTSSGSGQIGSKLNSIVILMIFAAGLLLPNMSRAAVIISHTGEGDASTWLDFFTIADIDKPAYNPGENITVSATGYLYFEANTPHHQDFKVTAEVNGDPSTRTAVIPLGSSYKQPYSSTVKAPAVPGSYNMLVQIWTADPSGNVTPHASGLLPFEVVGMPDQVLRVSIVSGSGKITSSDGQINCYNNTGACGPVSYPYGTMVVLAQTNTIGYGFVGWSGNVSTRCTSTSATCTVGMDQNRLVTAAFSKTTNTDNGGNDDDKDNNDDNNKPDINPGGKVSLDITTIGPGFVFSSDGKIACGSGGACKSIYNSGYNVSLDAMTSDPKSLFSWRGDIGSCDPSFSTCSLQNLIKDTRITALFSPKLTLSVGANGYATVNYNGLDKINKIATCAQSSTCSYQTYPGTSARIVATGNAPTWSGDGTDCSLDRCLEMSISKSVALGFGSVPPPKIGESSPPPGGGRPIVSCSSGATPAYSISSGESFKLPEKLAMVANNSSYSFHWVAKSISGSEVIDSANWYGGIQEGSNIYTPRTNQVTIDFPINNTATDKVYDIVVTARGGSGMVSAEATCAHVSVASGNAQATISLGTTPTNATQSKLSVAKGQSFAVAWNVPAGKNCKIEVTPIVPGPAWNSLNGTKQLVGAVGNLPTRDSDNVTEQDYLFSLLSTTGGARTGCTTPTPTATLHIRQSSVIEI